MVDSNCADLHDRVDAVALAIRAGLAAQAEPARLPDNIYSTYGDWETYSSPSRDARLKTAFKELRDAAERFVRLYRSRDPMLVYKGKDLIGDLIATYDRKAAQCTIAYTRSDGSPFTIGYEEARKRLFAFSFDPYQCVERRWGAALLELATCPDTASKAAWYEAQQNLRNQIDRTYEAEMDFTLAELKILGPGKGVSAPPDIDVRGFLVEPARRAPDQTADRERQIRKGPRTFRRTAHPLNRVRLFLRVERPELGHRHPFRVAAHLGEGAARLILLAGTEIGRAETDLRIVYLDLVFLDASLDGADRIVKLALPPELLADLDQRIARGRLLCGGERCREAGHVGGGCCASHLGLRQTRPDG